MGSVAGTESAAGTRAARRPRPSADRTRQHILEAALDEFAQRAFDGASTRRIAAQAGVTQPLLNYHFRTKADLWRAVVDGLFTRLRRTLEPILAAVAGADDVTVMRALVRGFVGFSAGTPELHRIITSECRADGARMDYLVDRHIRPLYEDVAERFARLVDAGAVPDVAPAHLYYLLTGAAPTMFVLGPECRRLTGLDPGDPVVIDAHADAVCALLFGAVRQPASSVPANGPGVDHAP